MKKIYSDDELFCNNEQKAYSGDAGCVDFLLGGIGTGNVSLGARGNRPNAERSKEGRIR